MPRVRPPRSDAGQLHLLGTAIKTAATDAAQNRSYLPSGLVADISGFVNDRQENAATIPGHASLLARRAALEGHVTRETGQA